MKGPEDTPKWRHPSNTTSTPVAVCRNCRTKISLYHCAEGGCPWCAKCGTKVTAKKEK